MDTGIEPRRIKAKITNEFVTFPHNLLSTTAWFFKQRVDAAHQPGGDMEGVFLQMIAVITMAAFSLEGYVNYIGQRVMGEEWRDMQSTKDKLKCIRRATGIEIDWNRRPFSTVSELVDLRNQLAHPKAIHAAPSEFVAEGTFEDLKRMLREYKPELQEIVTPEFVTRAYDDVEAIWQTLLKAAGVEEHETWDGGSQGIEFIAFADEPYPATG